MHAAQNSKPVDVQRLLTRERAIAGFFGLEFFAAIYLQKLALPLGVFEISIMLAFMFGGLIAMAILSKIEVSAMRVVVYATFFASAVFSQSQVKIPYSAPSMLIMLLMYLPFVVMWRIDSETHQQVMRTFQKFMLVPVVMVGLQLLSQMAFGLGNMPNLENYVPKILLRTGFNYDNIYHFGEAFKRPNGLFFLEPSFVSAFIGIALVIELTFFRRLRWLAFFAIGLVATFAATGQLLVALAVPFLLHRQTPKMLTAAALVGVLGILAMVAMGKGVSIDRLQELGSTGTSGYIRLVAPIKQLGVALDRPDVLFTGAGAGNIDHERSSPWPVTKLIYEYGAATAVSFMLLLFVSMWRAPAKGLAFALFFTINFTGGYLLEPVAMSTFALLCCMLVVSNPPPDRRRLRSPAAGPQPELPIGAAPVFERKVAGTSRAMGYALPDVVDGVPGSESGEVETPRPRRRKA